MESQNLRFKNRSHAQAVRWANFAEEFFCALCAFCGLTSESESFIYVTYVPFVVNRILLLKHPPALRRQLDRRLLSHAQLRVAGEFGEQRHAVHFHFQ